tara:strand:+ start:3611 stop:4180 length:570 start_codon:yes stop_codon:yes gene_type:complete
MFTKSFEPLSQSERVRNKRNKAIYDGRNNSNDVCLDANGNIKNAKNYETFMNTVNGYYECKKTDISNNRDCFNTYLDSGNDSFSVNTFQDVRSNFIDFQMYDDDTTNKSAVGRKNVKAKIDGTNTFMTAINSANIGINSAANITYPYEKPGLCSKYVIQKVSYFDPSGNFGNKFAKDIKKHFPLTKIGT